SNRSGPEVPMSVPPAWVTPGLTSQPWAWAGLTTATMPSASRPTTVRMRSAYDFIPSPLLQSETVSQDAGNFMHCEPLLPHPRAVLADTRNHEYRLNT